MAEPFLLKCLETSGLCRWVWNWVEDIRVRWRVNPGEFSVSSFQFSVGNGVGRQASGFGRLKQGVQSWERRAGWDNQRLPLCPSCLGGYFSTLVVNLSQYTWLVCETPDVVSYLCREQ